MPSLHCICVTVGAGLQERFNSFGVENIEGEWVEHRDRMYAVDPNRSVSGLALKGLHRRLSASIVGRIRIFLKHMLVA